MKQALNIKEAYNLFHQGMQSFARAERQGIRIDIRKAKSFRRKLTKEIEENNKQFLSSDFYKDWKKRLGHTNINIRSNKQLGEYLYKLYGVKVQKQTKSSTENNKKGSTDFEALNDLTDKVLPGLDKILRIRKLEKIRDTFLEGFIKEETNGFIHPFFNLHTVTTYRSSSADPNFQNIPVRDKEAKKYTRSILYPRKGHYLLEIDYGQLEVRVSCCYHKDQNMIKYVKDPSTDMHRDMAEQIFILQHDDIDFNAFKTLRSGAKNAFVFPQFYGDYYKNNAKGLSKWIELKEGRWNKPMGININEDITIVEHLKRQGVKSYKSFEKHLWEVEQHFWNERFYHYSEWKEKTWKQYQKKGYYDTLTGFRLKGIMSRNQLLNSPIQGSAFHCLLWSFNELDRIMRKEKWDTKLCGQIHDSILLDVHPDELSHVLQTARKVTCSDLLDNWKWIIVPFEIEAELSDIDCSWYDKKEIKFEDYE